MQQNNPPSQLFFPLLRPIACPPPRHPFAGVRRLLTRQVTLLLLLRLPLTASLHAATAAPPPPSLPQQPPPPSLSQAYPPPLPAALSEAFSTSTNSDAAAHPRQTHLRRRRRHLPLVFALKDPIKDQLKSPLQQTLAAPLIRVRLTSEGVSVKKTQTPRAPTCRVQGFDLQFSQSFQGQRQFLQHVDQDSRWNIQCSHQSVQVFAVGSKKPILHLEPQTTLIIQTPANLITWNKRSYHQELRIIPAKTGNKCQVINVLPLEKYLEGLINAEFSSAWPEEAVAAQMVAARSYALAKIQQVRTLSLLPLDEGFDVESSVQDQVYWGSQLEDARSALIGKKTRGLVLFANDQPLKAFYHALCGGKTSLPEQVWGQKTPGFTTPVRCRYCARAPHFNWQATLSTSYLLKALSAGLKKSQSFTQQAPPLPSSLPATGLERLSRTPTHVLIDWAPPLLPPVTTADDPLSLHQRPPQSFRLAVPLQQFRAWMGTTLIRSQNFQITAPARANRDQWTFQGHGYGHGVGLCQWGAKEMGHLGKSMQQILNFYYPKVQLKKLW